MEEHSELNKNEKIAAARKKLKQYKQKTSKSTKSADNLDESSVTNANSNNAPPPPPLAEDTKFVTENVICTPQNDKTSFGEYAKDYNEFNTINFNNYIGNNTNFTEKNYFDTYGSEAVVNRASSNGAVEDIPIEQIVSHTLAETNFFDSPHISDDPADKLQRPFNFLKITELGTNSETISTISEHTENDFSLGLGNEKDNEILTTNVPYQEIITAGIDETKGSCSSSAQIVDYEILFQSEKIKTNELNYKLNDQQKLIDELKFELDKVKSFNQAGQNNQTDIAQLHDRLRNQTTTIGVLVGEKTDLSSSLAKIQNLLKDKLNELDDSNNKLSTHQYRVAELEREINHLKISCDRLTTADKNFIAQIEGLQSENARIKLSNEELLEENAILGKKNEIKINEMTKVENELKLKLNEIEKLKLKIEQLTSYDTIAENTDELSELKKVNDEYLRQVNELKATNNQQILENDQLNEYYKNYLQQLNNEIGNLTKKCTDLSVEKERFLQREEELVRHVSQLEKSLQQMNSRMHNESKVVENINNDIKYIEEIEKMSSRIIDLERQTSTVQSNEEFIEKLKSECQLKTDEVERLKLKIEQLTPNQMDSTNIRAVMESDRLAASRAIAQNVELKDQLDEIQRAFVQISNDKLDLTTRLQNEQHLGSEIKRRFMEMEQENETIKAKFNLKDEEMIRLTHENTSLNQEILKYQQELDKLRHYEAKSHLGTMLQMELQNEHDQIASLRSRLKEYESMTANSGDAPTTDTVVAEIENQPNDTNQNVQNASITTNNNNIMIASHEAIEKLQLRFKKTMDEIADLTEEKHKLEHLVMQLQGETETIGEYVALYQTQRRLLKQRETEKDVELQKLAADREQMENKLAYLNNLIEQLLIEKGLEPHRVNHIPNSDSYQQSERLEQFKLTHTTAQLGSDGQKEQQWNNDSTTQTAVKILNLLEEIKVVNNSMDSLQHCPCCSGKWETV